MKMNNDKTRLLLFYTSVFALCFVKESTPRQLHSLHPTTFYLLHLNEGDICRRGRGSGPDYKCTNATDCEPFAESIQNEDYLDLCSIDGWHLVVCCPMTSDKKANVSIAEKTGVEDIRNTNTAVGKCYQYSELEFPTDDHDDRSTAVGVTTATPGEFPHMALIGYGETTENRNDFKCGGSLISESWILTAANCYRDSSGSLAHWARLGESDIRSTADRAPAADYEIIQHIVHPDFRARTELYNDIALFRLETEVEFSASVRPICLNADPLLYPTRMIATGWGTTAIGETKSDVLLKIPLNNVPVDRCNETYSSVDDSRIKLGILPDSMICAGPLKAGKSACMGFVGGPLQTRNDKLAVTYTQFGVTSFGLGNCDDKAPGVYTRVSNYIKWIEEIVWSNTQ